MPRIKEARNIAPFLVPIWLLDSAHRRQRRSILTGLERRITKKKQRGVAITKYRAKPTEIDGIRFKSLGEANRYCQLKLQQAAGEIADLTCHPIWQIKINNIKVCKVELDFGYWDKTKGEYIYEDFKGCDNAMSKLKRKLLAACHGIAVLITGRKRK